MLYTLNLIKVKYFVTSSVAKRDFYPFWVSSSIKIHPTTILFRNQWFLCWTSVATNLCWTVLEFAVELRIILVLTSFNPKRRFSGPSWFWHLLHTTYSILTRNYFEHAILRQMKLLGSDSHMKTSKKAFTTICLNCTYRNWCTFDIFISFLAQILISNEMKKLLCCFCCGCFCPMV